MLDVAFSFTVDTPPQHPWPQMELPQHRNKMLEMAAIVTTNDDGGQQTSMHEYTHVQHPRVHEVQKKRGCAGNMFNHTCTAARTG